MANIFQCLGVVVVCVAVSNCAGRSAVVDLTSDLSQPERTFWNDERDPEVSQAAVRRLASVPNEAPARRQASVRREPTASGLASTVSTASTVRSSSASSGQNVFTPEWYASEKAEADRMKRLTNICRC